MSIKVKFIFTILLILVISLGAYLYYALKLFSEDKTSYVFESSHQTAKLISKEVESLIQAATYNAQVFSRLSSQGVNLDESLLSLKSEFLMFSHYGKESSQRLFNPKLKELYGVSREKVTEIEKTIGEEKENIKIKNVSTVIGIPALSVLIRNSYTNEKFLYVISLAKVIDSLERGRGFEGYLFDGKGRFFNKKTDLKNEILLEILESDQISSSKVSRSEEYLFSFVKLPHYEINIASVIRKTQALKAVQFLIERFLGVGAILFGVAIIIGVFLSSGIAKPISQLALTAETISTGNYGVTTDLNIGGEVGSLSNSFDQMSLKIKETIDDLIHANQQLDYMNKNLENLVEQRTRELKDAHSYLDAMINSFDQGLLVFDKKFVCNPVYTKVCESHFDIIPGGRNFLDILQISEESKRNTFERWKDNLFQELIPFESIAELGPDRLVRGEDGSEDFKFISLKYFPMRDENNEVSNVVVVATDTTKEVSAQNKLKQEREEIQRIVNIIENKEQFVSFMSDFEAMNKYLTGISSGENKLKVSNVKSLLHSMKGSAGVYHLGGIYDRIDQLEERIQDIPEDQLLSVLPTELQKVSGFVSSEIKDLKIRVKSFLGEQMVDGIRRYDKRLDHISIVREKLKTENRNVIRQAFDLYIFKIEVAQLLRAYINMVSDLGVVLGKELKPLLFEGGSTRVHPTAYESLFNSLSHIFRNIVDHGIEEPYEREKKKKDIEGSVLVKISKDKTGLMIEISDDGRGIDFEKIRNRLKDLNYPGEVSSKPDNEIIQYIFDEGFSTKNISTDISGRGVGLYAVKMEVQKLKGKILVKSFKGKGTKFLIKVPNA